MANKFPLKNIRQNYLKKIDSLKSGKGYEELLAYIKEHGENYVIHRARNESRHFDVEWINELDKGLQAIDRIIAAPKTFIKENAQVVLAGLAKRVSSQSVTHLASHSQFVRGFDEDGNVIPEKILSISSEENYQTYENRFVMSLIMKLSVFVANRYNYIKTHGETWNTNVLLLHSKVEIDGITYEIDNRVRLSEPSEDETAREYNEQLLDKIQLFSNRVMFYLNSPFMKKMKEAKIVHNPIAMTNILAKNPEYHQALKLWRFLDRYTQLGVDYSVEEGNVPFTDEYYDEVFNIAVGNLLSLDARQVDKITLHEEELENVKKKVFVPKTLTNIEDIAFLNGKFQYEQFPQVKEAYEKLIRSQEEEPLAPTFEEARIMRLQEEDAQRDMVIYARDIHETQERLRDKAARIEDRKRMEGRQFFNEFLEAEKKRLDEIEAADKANREYEEKLLKQLREERARRYEESLLDDTKRRIMEEALHDRIIEDKFLGRPKEESKPFTFEEEPEKDFTYHDVPYGEFRETDEEVDHPEVPDFEEGMEQAPQEENIPVLEEPFSIEETQAQEEASAPQEETVPAQEQPVEEQPALAVSEEQSLPEENAQEAAEEASIPEEGANQEEEPVKIESQPASEQLSLLVGRALRLAKKAVKKEHRLEKNDQLEEYRKEGEDGKDVYEFTLGDPKTAEERVQNQEALEEALLETVQKGKIEPPKEEPKPEPKPNKAYQDRLARAMALAMEALKLSQEGGKEIEGKKKVDDQGRVTYEFDLNDLKGRKDDKQ